ncbi:hypothetical protein HYW75_04525 [Candidatus Pacearchaeota archaeon]|nr:hypothetical protein [Candidatus Pacearchaeota archaeon]
MERQEIILYKNKPLERITASNIVLREETPLMKEKRLFLASDVIVGEYGITGFVAVDNKPEDRWWSYTEGDRIGVKWSVEDSPLLVAWKVSNPKRLSHYINTSTGFKMIRYFVLPSSVQEFFRRDKFLGDPLINKCAREGTILEEFDEVLVNPTYAFSGEQRELIDGILEHINPRLEKIGESRLSWEDYGHAVYFSFHPWQEYKPILEIGQESIMNSVLNFDKFLSHFDQRKTLKKRVLELK